MRKLPLYLLLISAPAFAAQEYTITASSLYHPGNSIGGESTVITETDLDLDQDLFVREALRDAPSVLMGGTGENGRLTRFSIRGAVGGENLVLIDGIPVNDPSASGGTFDFSDMMVDDIEQIEILPGANSVIYGSDAMGGIINMVTKSGQGKTRMKGKVEGGSFRTGKGAVTVSGREGRVGYALTGAGFKSGTGSFTNKLHGNRQGDKYQNSLGSGRISYAISPNVEVEGVLRWNEAKLRFDNIVGRFPVKANNNLRTRRNVSQAKVHGSFFNDFWEKVLRFSRSETRRQSQMPGCSFSNRGQLYKLHSRSDLNWSKEHITTVGGEYGWEQVNTTFAGNHNRDQQAVFAQHLLRLWEGNEIVGGARFDHFESVGERVTYRSGISQTCGDTRLRASYGTGFKAPLLTDQFNTSPFALTNPSLKPEKNHSMDAGFGQKLFKDRAELNFTAFLNVIYDVFVNRRVGLKTQRINGGRRISRGVEGKLRVDPCSLLSLRSNLTFVVAQDKNQGRTQKSPHIPRLVVNGKAVIKPCKDGRLFVSTHYVSSQKDGSMGRGLKPYATMSVGGEVDVTKEVQVYGRVENLTDKRYEETFGFGIRGRAFYLGLRAII